MIRKPLRGSRPKPFGSLTERFEKARISGDPGVCVKHNSQPGDYNPDNPASNPLGFSTYNYLHHFTAKHNQHPEYGVSIKRKDASMNDEIVVRKGAKLKVTVGNALDHSKIHIPIFGAQSDRFISDQEYSIPPPGSYEVSRAFEKLRQQGKARAGIVATMSQRNVFKGARRSLILLVSNNSPGPGSYNPPLTTKPIPKNDGTFLSTEERFSEKFIEKKPAPNEYLVNEYGKSLIRKTFNISLGVK